MMNYLLFLLPILGAVAVIVWDRLSVRRTLDGMDRLLDRAIRGETVEEHFDESFPSHLEGKLAQYLSASAISAQNVAQEREKLKMLVADISHQTKTPIANVLLYAQLLEEQELTPDGRACADALEQQAKKLQSLIGSLVKTSRLETGVLVMHPEPGPLEPMLAEAAAQFAPRAAERNVELCLLPSESKAVFDRKWTAEAVCNLLDNAVKYTPSGGRITLEAVEFELFSRISVTDTGPGIEEAEQPRIFQRFYRSPSVSQTEGVGIGLYLTRQIATRQNGYIKVDSRPGQGSRFSLYLPKG